MTKGDIVNQTIASANLAITALNAKASAFSYSTSNGFVQWTESLERYVLPHILFEATSLQITTVQYVQNLRNKALLQVNQLDLAGAVTTLTAFIAEVTLLTSGKRFLKDSISYLPVYEVD